MFRLWAKEWKDNHLVKDMVVENSEKDTRTHKVLKAVDEVCRQFDLSTPIWLESSQKEFKRLSRTRFTQDAFVEVIPFDYLEIQVIEED